MRIAVAAEASDADAPVSFYDGRAPICLVFDEHGELRHSFANPFARVGRHAEHGVSRMMLEQHVDVMVAPLVLTTRTCERRLCMPPLNANV